MSAECYIDQQGCMPDTWGLVDVLIRFQPED